MRRISGLHLLVDGFVRDPVTLEPGNICDLFDKLVDALNMKYLMHPVAMRVPLDPNKLQTDDDEGGWSVICQITTSHLSLHGWPARGAFMLDAFSCCQFNTEKAKQIIYNHLGVSEANVQVITRSGPKIKNKPISKKYLAKAEEIYPPAA